MAELPLENGAQAQIDRLLAAAKTKSGDQIAAAPEVTFLSANDQIAKLFGTASPGAADISTYKGKVVSRSEGAGPADLTARDAATVASLEERFSSVEKSLVVAKVELPARKQSGVTSHAGTGNKAVPRSVPVTAWSGTGKLTIAKCDKILLQLRDFIGATCPAVQISEKDVALSCLEQNSVKLEGPLAILTALAPQSFLGGDSLEAQAQVQQWCNYAMDEMFTGLADKSDKEKIRVLGGTANTHLAAQAYLAGFQPSVADLLLWGSVAPVYPELPGAYRETVPNITRWFNHTQHLPGLTKSPIFVSPNKLNPAYGH